MYRGFQILSLKKGDIVSYTARKFKFCLDDGPELMQIGKCVINNYKKGLEKAFDFLSKDFNGKIDGERMASFWFPKCNAEVFISHSHLDVELAT